MKPYAYHIFLANGLQQKVTHKFPLTKEVIKDIVKGELAEVTVGMDGDIYKAHINKDGLEKSLPANKSFPYIYGAVVVDLNEQVRL